MTMWSVSGLLIQPNGVKHLYERMIQAPTSSGARKSVRDWAKKHGMKAGPVTIEPGYPTRKKWGVTQIKVEGQWYVKASDLPNLIKQAIRDKEKTKTKKMKTINLNIKALQRELDLVRCQFKKIEGNGK